MGLDIMDWCPGPGRRLSTRRLLVVVEHLDVFSSLFWSAVLDRDPTSHEELILAGIFRSLTGEDHPLMTRREDARRAREREEKKARVRRLEKRRQAFFRAEGITT